MDSELSHTVYFWDYFTNGTYYQRMTPGEIFSQPFTQIFGSTLPLFEGLSSPLNANDIIVAGITDMLVLFNI